MLLIPEIEKIPKIHQPCGLTIGSFDGVHLGHQTLLKRLREKLPLNSLLVVYTFTNHPSHLFAPHAPIPLICSPLQKVKLLGDYGADMVIFTPFDQQFAKMPFDKFLELLKQKLCFSHLVLGAGATFGCKRQGKEENVRELATSLNFEVEYLPKTHARKKLISSGLIRTLIQSGAFHEASECLGRPYSLMGHLNVENGCYNFPTQGLCLPPDGIYPVRIKTELKSYLGRAQISPRDQKIYLETIKQNLSLKNKEIEIVF